MKINQLNGQGVENSMKNIHNRVMKVMRKEENIVSKSLLNRFLQATAVEILSTLTTNEEERRIIWTTHNNLKSWFDNLEHDLEDLGFAKRDKEGDLYSCASLLMVETGRGVDVRRRYFTAPASHELEGIRAKAV